MSGEKLADHERPRLGDDLKQHPHTIQSAPSFDPSDGLPRMTSAVTMTDSMAPALTHDTFVCMGDERTFVIRDVWDNVLLEIDGRRARRLVDERGEAWVAALSKEEEIQAKGPGCYAGGDDFWFKVEPRRPQCKYYKRVMTDFEGDQKVRQVERVCSAQRTEGGEYVSLRDTRVLACEHRSPPDFVSLERLRQFDAERVRDAEKRDEEFDVEAALAEAGAGESK